MGTVLIVLDSNKAGHKRLLRIAGKTGYITFYDFASKMIVTKGYRSKLSLTLQILWFLHKDRHSAD
jgi:hypothetical protein